VIQIHAWQLNSMQKKKKVLL